MSSNFAMKDLYHFRKQAKSYLKGTISIIALSILFLNLIQSVGFLTQPAEVNYLSYTFIELYSQYNTFLISLTIVLTVVIVVSSNHAVIQHRKKDIAIMKSLGTYPNQLYKFYIKELLILITISFLIGWVIGFGIFLIIFMILENRLSTLIWYPDRIFTFIIIFLLYFLTYLVNGWEIRNIGQKNYNQIKSGNIQENISARLSEGYKKFLRKMSLSLTIAIKNLKRKGYAMRQSVAMVALAGTIILSGVIGVFVLNNTSITYINQAQGEKIVVIGAKPVINEFQLGYTQFADPNAKKLSLGNYTDPAYNITANESNMSQFLAGYQIDALESRLFSVQEISELSGYVLTNPDTINNTSGQNPDEDIKDQYTIIGSGNGTRVVPIQGIIYGNTLQNWSYGGALVNIMSGAVVGDTLAGEIYENAYLQGLSIENTDQNRTYTYRIHGVVIDPMNNGNSAYVHLPDLQESLGRENYTNLFLVDYTNASLAGKEGEFLSALETYVKLELGDAFGIIDLKETFEKNIDAIKTNQYVILTLSVIMTFFAVYVIYHYQKGRIEEDQKDLAIFKAMGGTKRHIQNSLFYEQTWLAFIGLSIALALSMVFIIMFLMEDAILPSIWFPIGSYFILVGSFVILSYINSKILTRQFYSSLLTLQI
jgi:ABC-type antimicrobial peptide transport system permease subunit